MDYLSMVDATAREVWIVFEDGQIEVHDTSGRLEPFGVVASD